LTDDCPPKKNAFDHIVEATWPATASRSNESNRAGKPSSRKPKRALPSPAETTLLKCSFCGAGQHDAEVLIKAPEGDAGSAPASICESCVQVCVDLLRNRPGEDEYQSWLT
jgi:hypothetical protein